MTQENPLAPLGEAMTDNHLRAIRAAMLPFRAVSPAGRSQAVRRIKHLVRRELRAGNLVQAMELKFIARQVSRM